MYGIVPVGGPVLEAIKNLVRRSCCSTSKQLPGKMIELGVGHWLNTANVITANRRVQTISLFLV